MKKLLLILLPISLLLINCTEDELQTNNPIDPTALIYTYIPDTYFEQELIDLGLDDVLDDSVFTGNINDLEEIWLNDLGIKDLTGIEDFVALTILDCSYNQLTSLDLSQNTALTNLDCSYNLLNSLNVNGANALSTLNCADNQLTSLDVSNNTSLAWMLCYDNLITSLDVSQHTAFTYLDCSSNQLTSLDVSQNTALTGLGCEDNQLTSLDLSKNTALTNLHCYDNLLTSLDVRNGNNTNITVFWSGNNPNLSCINVDDFQYSNINWPVTNIAFSFDPQHYFSEACP